MKLGGRTVFALEKPISSFAEERERDASPVVSERREAAEVKKKRLHGDVKKQHIRQFMKKRKHLRVFWELVVGEKERVGGFSNEKGEASFPEMLHF